LGAVTVDGARVFESEGAYRVQRAERAISAPRPIPPGHIAPIVRENVARETALMTDEGNWYTEVGGEFISHETVKHSVKEYVRGHVHTNTVEGYYSIFKRGMKGVYQHCAEKHLHRYLAEFDFRYSNRVRLGVNAGERAALAVKNATGKRLTYRQPRQA
jgi:hypothetical protein